MKKLSSLEQAERTLSAARERLSEAYLRGEQRRAELAAELTAVEAAIATPSTDLDAIAGLLSRRDAINIAMTHTHAEYERLSPSVAKAEGELNGARESLRLAIVELDQRRAELDRARSEVETAAHELDKARNVVSVCEHRSDRAQSLAAQSSERLDDARRAVVAAGGVPDDVRTGGTA